MKTQLKSLLAMALFTFSLSAVADEYENRLLERAQKGELRAQEEMGDRACSKGDYYSALDWYEKVAAGSYDKAGQILKQYGLAAMYYGGKCIGADYEQGTPNYPKALEWYSKVAYSSNEIPMFSYNSKLYLAEIYFWGKGGINKDVRRAKRLYEELANLADSIVGKGLVQETRGNARHRLAHMHYYGNFATQDYGRAYQWAEKAVQDGNPYALILKAVLLYKGLGVTQNRAEGLRVMGGL